jgi:hypothetical protein
MGLFDFFKKKQTGEQNILENYNFPYFGEININNLEEYYSSNFEMNNNTIRTDLNFGNKKIEKYGIAKIEGFLKNVNNFDDTNKVYIEKNFNEESGEALEYINFYLEEFDENELSKLIDLDNENIPKNIQLLNKLKLIRIGLYPDRKYGTEYFATFDYSIEIGGEFCNQLLVVNTDEKGNLHDITWES